MSYLDIEGKEVRVSNLDKVLWPITGTSKGLMLKYYIKAAPQILPGLKNRLIALRRFPDGVDGEGFYQKNCPDGAPEWIKTYLLPRKGGKSTRYILVEDVATLIWLANLGAVEFHPWLSSINYLDNPDYAVFDLDPMERYGMREVKEIALAIGSLLTKLGLRSGIKTSGATGLQIFVPIQPLYTYSQVRDFVQACCIVVNRRFAGWTTLERNVKDRQGKIYLDYMQNAREKTIVAAFSLRPQPTPVYSAPLSWQWVENNNIDPTRFDLNSYLKNGHPFSWLTDILPQRLEQAVLRLQEHI